MHLAEKTSAFVTAACSFQELGLENRDEQVGWHMQGKQDTNAEESQGGT